MRLLMLCREPRLYSCQRLKTAAAQRGFSLDILDPNRFLLQLTQQAGKPAFELYYQAAEVYDKNRPAPVKVDGYAGVIPRFGTSSTEMGCAVLRHFEAQGVPVLNNATAFALARDKWRSLQALAVAGIAVPTTLIGGELTQSFDTLSRISAPLVLKTLSGSQGVGVMLAEQAHTASSMLDTLKQAKIPVLAQQFIAESQGQDIRAFVVGDQVVAAMQRSGKAGEFRANIHQGGTADKIELSKSEQQLAILSAQTLGLAVAGVDLIRSASGLLVLEVNASAGLEKIEQVSGVDIAGLMIDQLLKKDR